MNHLPATGTNALPGGVTPRNPAVPSHSPSFSDFLTGPINVHLVKPSGGRRRVAMCGAPVAASPRDDEIENGVGYASSNPAYVSCEHCRAFLFDRMRVNVRDARYLIDLALNDLVVALRSLTFGGRGCGDNDSVWVAGTFIRRATVLSACAPNCGPDHDKHCRACGRKVRRIRKEGSFIQHRTLAGERCPGRAVAS